jgi:hypothetical protein
MRLLTRLAIIYGIGAANKFHARMHGGRDFETFYYKGTTWLAPCRFIVRSYATNVATIDGTISALPHQAHGRADHPREHRYLHCSAG